jgi:hypothetical protein
MASMDADPVAGVNGVRAEMGTEGASGVRWRASVSDRLVSD